ncbi:MAG: cupin domain-containing protein [Saprospiraceae bacterium]
MREIQVFLESGAVEAYCLGQLEPVEMRAVEALVVRHPEIWVELTRTYANLHQLAAETPAQRTRKANILHTLHQLHLENEMSLEKLPLLTPYSDYRKWSDLVRGLSPTHQEEDIEFRVLQETPQLLQTLVWVNTSVEEEGHDPNDFEESFLVLAGECECNLDGEIFRLGAGAYLAIPPNTAHSVRNLFPDQPLMGIVQRYKAAA